MTITLPLPRFVVAKTLADGLPAFYFSVPTKFRRAGCPVPDQPLGRDYTSACAAKTATVAVLLALIGLVDEWQAQRHGLPVTGVHAPIYGTVRWLFQEYRRGKAYTEKVSARSRPDYERTMLMVEDVVTKKGDKIGDRRIKAITPNGADKIYAIILDGPEGKRPRQAEKAVTLCRRAWRVVHRLYPGEFSRDVPNPWDGVTMQRRIKGKKRAVTREQVYIFARGAIDRGRPEAAAAAVICYEWLQRPENVLKRACCAGQTTAAPSGRTPLRFYTTKPVQRSGTRWRTSSAAPR